MDDNTPKMLDIDDLSGPIITNNLERKRRITVRYVREDIKATLRKVKIYFFGAPLNIQLLDLSTKGALVSTDRKIRINKKITLFLEFEDGQTFEIEAKVVRMDAFSANTYGIKFGKYNDALGDYILKTQTNLIFK